MFILRLRGTNEATDFCPVDTFASVHKKTAISVPDTVFAQAYGLAQRLQMSRSELYTRAVEAYIGEHRRPVLVVQDDAFNASKINTVIVVTLTSNMTLHAAPGNVMLSKRNTRLPKASVANVSQILTLDKSFLTDRVAKIDASALREIDDGLRLVLSI